MPRFFFSLLRIKKNRNQLQALVKAYTYYFLKRPVVHSNFHEQNWDDKTIYTFLFRLSTNDFVSYFFLKTAQEKIKLRPEHEWIVA